MTRITIPGAGASAGLSRRSLLTLFGAGAVGLGLSGCNFTSSGGGGAASGDFTFTFWGTGAEKDAVTKVISDFAKSKGLNPKAQSIPDQYETKLNTLLAANQAPDAGYLTEAMSMRLGEEGKIVSILGKPGFDDILPQALHYWAPDKAVSQTAIESMVLWYDEAATSASGVTPPASPTSAWEWDKFVEAADQLTQDANGRRPSESGFDAGNVKRYGTAAPSALPAIVALLKSNGVELFDDAGTKTNLDTPDAIAVIQKIADLVFQHRVAPTAAQAATFGASTALLLASGRVAMAVDGQWALLDLGQSKVKYNASVLPKFKEAYTTVLAGASAVFTSSKHQEPGFELLAQLGDPEKVPLYANGLWMPLQKKYYTDQTAIDSWTKNSVHPSNFRTAVIDAVLGNTVALPSYKIKNWATIQTTLVNGLSPLFTQQTDVRAACSRLAADVNKLMQGAYQDKA
ncbi:extracellular solute-binding protein [Pseudarthrobacter phenanthrenivorans]|uniref:ABC transporter substrate-binding protein n=1 Tax=Pseudarthrobacter phenanthrenivorans TaxID=361575 RepID=UPI00344F3340